MNELNTWCKGKLQNTWLPETGNNCPQQHWIDAGGCKGGANFMITWSDSAGCVDMAISIHAGTLMTSLFGPIPCGCQTISKMLTRVGVSGFRVRVACKYGFAGYIGGYCLWHMNWWGVHAKWPLWQWCKLDHGFGVSKQSVDRSCGLCMIAVGACLAGTQGGAVIGMGNLVGEMGCMCKVPCYALAGW